MIDIVYIAAPYPLKEEARELRNQLERCGVVVTSRWLDGREDTDEQSAETDLRDVRAAQAVVLLNPDAWANIGTGGRHVEIGAALTYGMPVYILGVKSNVFHTMSLCHVVPTFMDLTSRLLHDNAMRTEVFSSTWMLQRLIERVHIANHKWWVDLDTGLPISRNVGELLMLTVSELAEAMEGHRKNLPDDKLPHRPMFTVEIADALIRLFDIAGGLSLALPDAFEEKMIYNAKREDHTAAHRRGVHGKKY